MLNYFLKFTFLTVRDFIKSTFFIKETVRSNPEEILLVFLNFYLKMIRYFKKAILYLEEAVCENTEKTYFVFSWMKTLVKIGSYQAGLSLS